jgi:hypothetical protein
MTRLRSLIVLVVCGYLSWTAPARAGAVEDWNDITSQAVAAAVPPRAGAAAILDFAMVHAAVYDAVQAIEGEFEPYAVEIPGASGSPSAAAAKAAHDVLVSLLPGQTASLDLTYHDYLANNGLAENDPGVAVGEQAAAGIIALRANDGSYPNPPPPDFFGGTDPGEWRPTPPGFAPMFITWFGTVTPYTLTSPEQFRAKLHPALTSGRYTKDYKEVKRLGRDVDSERTQDQTDLAYFWALNYISQWNLALREIAADNVGDISDSARLFALANFAMADAGITAWDSKSHFNFWRPVTAIQEGDNDGNPKTHGDTGWLPLIVTPAYPDYTSGANNLTGAVTSILKLFFGTDHFTFEVTSNNPLAVPPTRTYERFSDAASDVVDARIYEGIHFRFADTAARKQGRQVAKWAFKHFLRPVHSDDDCCGDEEEEEEED